MEVKDSKIRINILFSETHSEKSTFHNHFNLPLLFWQDSKRMKMSNLKAIVLIAMSTLWLFSNPCHADSNVILVSKCPPDNSTLDSEYQTNLLNLLNSLAANAPVHNGFNTTAVGEGANRIYGLTQCRGDISSKDCAACIKDATTARVCPDRTNVTIWFRWCLLRHSKLSFFGMREQSGFLTGFDADLEDPNVVFEALNFTDMLASSTPDKPLMFQTAVLDVGKSGKRYGLAQCTRDLSKSDCGTCLNNLTSTFNETRNRTGWEAYASSCSLLYHDYQFYLNEGSSRYSPHRVIGMAVPALVFLLVL